MKKLTILILSLFLIAGIKAQDNPITILGKVIDSATSQPLAGASAFAPNTTYGTITNADGYFYLRLPPGGFDLVVSYTGYEKSSTRISPSSPLPDTLVIALAQQNNSLTEVAFVASETPDGYKRFGKFFTDLFIGTTSNADSCTILNPEVLKFYYTKKRGRLKVMSSEDIMIANYALGYNIRYQLDSFSYDYNTKISQYTGYPLFTEMDSTEEAKAQWKKNRDKTYLGSRLHFMRSYYNQALREQGFLLEKVERTDMISIEHPYDSSLFVADSNSVEVLMDGKYRVNYRLVYPDKKFLREYKLPANSKMQVTILDVNGGFVIEENGYFYEQYDVIHSGYWAWKKIAELLPYDYYPDNRNTNYW